MSRIIDNDRFPLSPRIRTLEEIRAMLRPEPVREPLPLPKVYAPPRASARKRRVKSEPGRPATLGSSAAAGVRFIVWCKACNHQIEPDPREQAERYGTQVTVIDWHARLSCSKCGSPQIDMVVTGDPARLRVELLPKGENPFGSLCGCAFLPLPPPPVPGKSMLAARLPGILPPLEPAEALGIR